MPTVNGNHSINLPLMKRQPKPYIGDSDKSTKTSLLNDIKAAEHNSPTAKKLNFFKPLRSTFKVTVGAIGNAIRGAAKTLLPTIDFNKKNSPATQIKNPRSNLNAPRPSTYVQPLNDPPIDPLASRFKVINQIIDGFKKSRKTETDVQFYQAQLHQFKNEVNSRRSDISHQDIETLLAITENAQQLIENPTLNKIDLDISEATKITHDAIITINAITDKIPVIIRFDSETNETINNGLNRQPLEEYQAQLEDISSALTTLKTSLITSYKVAKKNEALLTNIYEALNAIDELKNAIKSKLDHEDIRESLKAEEFEIRKINADGYCGSRAGLVLGLLSLKIKFEKSGVCEIPPIGDEKVKKHIELTIKNQVPLLNPHGKLQKPFEAFIINGGLIPFISAENNQQVVSDQGQSGTYIQLEDIESIFNGITNVANRDNIEIPRLVSKADTVTEHDEAIAVTEGPIDSVKFLTEAHWKPEEAIHHPIADNKHEFNLAVSLLQPANRSDEGKNGYSGNHYEISIKQEYAHLLGSSSRIEI